MVVGSEGGNGAGSFENTKDAAGKLLGQLVSKFGQREDVED